MKKNYDNLAEKMFEHRLTVLQGVNTCNEIFAMLAVLDVYLMENNARPNGHTVRAFLEGIKTILIAGTTEVEEWLSIEDEWNELEANNGQTH